MNCPFLKTKNSIRIPLIKLFSIHNLEYAYNKISYDIDTESMLCSSWMMFADTMVNKGRSRQTVNSIVFHTTDIYKYL